MVAVSFGQLLGGTNNLTGDAAHFKPYFPLIRDEPFLFVVSVFFRPRVCENTGLELRFISTEQKGQDRVVFLCLLIHIDLKKNMGLSMLD